MKMLKSALAMVALLLSMAAFALDLDAAKSQGLVCLLYTSPSPRD